MKRTPKPHAKMSLTARLVVLADSVEQLEQGVSQAVRDDLIMVKVEVWGQEVAPGEP